MAGSVLLAQAFLSHKPFSEVNLDMDMDEDEDMSKSRWQAVDSIGTGLLSHTFHPSLHLQCVADDSWPLVDRLPEIRVSSYKWLHTGNTSSR